MSATETLVGIERLEERVSIDANLYEALQRGSVADSVMTPVDEFALERVERSGPTEGLRAYRWAA